MAALRWIWGLLRFAWIASWWLLLFALELWAERPRSSKAPGKAATTTAREEKTKESITPESVL